MDEHGRNPGDPKYKDPKLHEEEWIRHEQAKREWAKKRVGKSVAHVENFTREDEIGDKIMADHLAKSQTA